eukprot:scaffold23110_cov20-Tisochrysis_lutea.AAC.1
MDEGTSRKRERERERKREKRERREEREKNKGRASPPISRPALSPLHSLLSSSFSPLPSLSLSSGRPLLLLSLLVPRRERSISRSFRRPPPATEFSRGSLSPVRHISHGEILMHLTDLAANAALGAWGLFESRWKRSGSPTERRAKDAEMVAGQSRMACNADTN